MPRQRKRDEGGILDDYFNRRTLAKYLDVAAGTIANWQQVGKGPPGIVLGGQLLYRKTDVTKWLDQRHSGDRTLSTTTQAKQASVDLYEPQQQPIYWPTELVRAIETAAAEAGQSAPDFLCVYLSACFLTPASPATNAQPTQVPAALKRLDPSSPGLKLKGKHVTITFTLKEALAACQYMHWAREVEEHADNKKFYCWARWGSDWQRPTMCATDRVARHPSRVSKQLSLNVIAKLSRALLGEPIATPREDDGVGASLDYPHALVSPQDTHGEWNPCWKKQLAAAQETEEPPGDE